MVDEWLKTNSPTKIRTGENTSRDYIYSPVMNRIVLVDKSTSKMSRVMDHRRVKVRDLMEKGMDARQIAEHLGEPLSTVQRDLFSIRNSLVNA